MSSDMQRQRLRHLVSSAVHELWKKETGSVSSLLIEGTICITVHGGRTTVVQLSEHYAGLIPESVSCGQTEAAGNGEEETNGKPEAFGESTSDGGRSSLIVSPSRNGFAGGHDDVFFDESSAQRLGGYVSRKFSPNRRMGASVEADMDTNNNQKGVVDAERNNEESRNRRLLSSRPGDSNELDIGEFEEDSTEIDVDDEDIRSSSSNDDGRSGTDRRVVSRFLDEQRVVVSSYSGTAVKFEDSANDSAVQDMSMSFDTSRLTSSGRPDGNASAAAEDLRSPLSVSRRHSVGHQEASSKAVFNSPPPCGGLDSGSDLLLSSPQDLTAQVRNVIRQRLIKQLSPFEALHQGVVAAAAAATNGSIGQQSSTSFVRPHSSPYYRTLPSPLHWSTPLGSGNGAGRETQSDAARRLMTTSFGAAASSSLTSPINHQSQLQAHHHHHHHLLSPNSTTPTSVSTPIGMSGSSSPSAVAAAMQFGASLHNLLGMRAAAVAAVAAAAAGGQTLDLKMRGGGGPVASSPIGGSSNDPSGSPMSMLVGGGDLPMTAAEGSGSTSDVQKIYRCDYCFKTFLFKSKYHEHLPVHTSARPFQCHLCTRTYKYKYDLRVHLRTHLGIPTKSTVCPFCAGRFATNKLLRQHMRSAHSDNQVTTTSALTSGTEFGAGSNFAVAAVKSEIPASSTVTIAPSGSSSLVMSDGSSLDDSTSRMSDVAERRASLDDQVDGDDVGAVGPVVEKQQSVEAVS